MQKSKKLLSLILVMAMMVSMSVNCFAEPVGPGESPATFTKIVESPNEHTVPVNLAVEAATFNVTVPTELPITIDANGVDIAASNAKITNNGKGPVSIKSIAVAPTSGWSIVPINTDFSKVPADTKQIGLNMFGIEVPANGAFPVDSFKQIDGGTNLDLPYASKVATQKTGVTNTPVTIIFTFGWEELTVSEVTISQTTASINKGESLQLSSTTKYRETPVWSSSNEAIATVSQSGLVTAKDWGTATITVSVGGFSATCVVTVPKILNGITISQAAATINKGNNLQLTSNTIYRGAPVWSSSNDAVATVDQTGLVTARDWGTAIITVSVGGFSATCTVTVPKILNGITISQAAATINKGNNLQLTSNTIYRGAPVWSSSNDAVATVDQTGLVTARDWGTAIITVSVGGFSADCVVTVPKILDGVTISQIAATINKGDNLQLTSTTIYRNTPVWKSSDEKVATVNQSGLVTARDWGTATITVSVGVFSATCKITVPKIVNGITISQITASINKGSTLQLTSTTIYRSTPVWKSSDERVATVDQSGLVTAKDWGTAIITVSIGSFSATCTVTVPKIINGIDISQIAATINKGNTLQLSSTTKYRETPIWSSSNDAVATVDQTGLVTARDWGTATITVSVGGFSATCNITVPKIVSGITLNQTTANMKTQETLQLTADVKYRSTVTWSSSDSSVATVSNTGLVSALKAGSTTVKASIGGMEANCVITVTPAAPPPAVGTAYDDGTYLYTYGGGFNEYGDAILIPEQNGWGVQIKDRNSTAPVTKAPLSSIQGYPVTNMSRMFDSQAVSIDLSGFDTSNVTNMSDMFWYSAATTLNFPEGFGSNATNMGGMFCMSAATTLNLPAGFGSNATNMGGMFNGSVATTLDFPAGFGGNATDMDYMFYQAAATTLNLPAGFGSKATNMGSMFNGFAATIDFPAGFGSNATNMRGMFDGSYTTILDFPAGFGSKATNMGSMFNYSKATTLTLPEGFGRNATNMYSMFRNSAATKGYTATQAEADKWNNSTATTDKPAALTFTVKP